VVEGLFAGGFAKFGVQNVVNRLVKRGGVVVKVWLKTTANRHRKNMPVFCTFFAFYLIQIGKRLTVAGEVNSHLGPPVRHR
jgi:hypothetical protein